LRRVYGIGQNAMPRDYRSAVGLDLAYDTAGYLQSVTDAMGRAIRYTYDHDSTAQVGRLARVDGLEGATLYEYGDAAYSCVAAIA
jgi:hypothetical protein